MCKLNLAPGTNSEIHGARPGEGYTGGRSKRRPYDCKTVDVERAVSGLSESLAALDFVGLDG